jgi:molybdopterin-binding protein
VPIQVIDAANQFRGKVVEIVLGSVVSEVEVETPWGKVASVITTRSVRELGLEIGSEVIAFVKVTDMALAAVRDDRDATDLSQAAPREKCPTGARDAAETR